MPNRFVVISPSYHHSHTIYALFISVPMRFANTFGSATSPPQCLPFLPFLVPFDFFLRITCARDIPAAMPRAAAATIVRIVGGCSCHNALTAATHTSPTFSDFLPLPRGIWAPRTDVAPAAVWRNGRLPRCYPCRRLTYSPDHTRYRPSPFTHYLCSFLPPPQYPFRLLPACSVRLRHQPAVCPYACCVETHSPDSPLLFWL